MKKYVTDEIYDKYKAAFKLMEEKLDEWDISDPEIRSEFLAQELQMYLMGSGCSRVTVELDVNTVIKFINCEEGYKSNAREVALYNKVPEELKKYLVDILEYRDKEYDYVVMPLCEPIYEDTWEDYELLASEIVDKFRDAGIRFTDLESYTNFALMDGEYLVICDYGDYELIEKTKKLEVF